MIYATELEDGRLVNITDRRAPAPGDVVLDAMPAGFGPFMCDPANPRCAVPHAALIAARAAEVRVARLIDLEARRAAAGRLGLANEEARLAAEIRRAL